MLINIWRDRSNARDKEGLSIHAPSIIPRLQPGAWEEEIQVLEARLGIEFPQDVRESYRIHNGMFGEEGFICGWSEFYPLEEIFTHWDCWTDMLEVGEFFDSKSTPKGPIKTDWWNRKWIPLLGNGGGDHCCIDLDPAPEGQWGQVIAMWHETGAEDVLAPSFKNFLANFAEELHAGVYTFSEEFGGLITVTEFEEYNAEKQENERRLTQFKKKYAVNPQSLEADARKQLLSHGIERDLSEKEKMILKSLANWVADSDE